MESLSSEINIDKFCRTCAMHETQQKLVPLFQTNNPAIKCIENFLNPKFTVNFNDQLPQQICLDCINKFNLMNDFLQLCQESQKYLKRLFLSSRKFEIFNYETEHYRIKEETYNLSDDDDDSTNNDNDATTIDYAAADENDKDYEVEFLFEEYIDDYIVTTPAVEAAETENKSVEDRFVVNGSTSPVPAIYEEEDENEDEMIDVKFITDLPLPEPRHQLNETSDQNNKNEIDYDDDDDNNQNLVEKYKNFQTIQVKIEKLNTSIDENIFNDLSNTSETESEAETEEINDNKENESSTKIHNCQYCARDFKTLDLLNIHNKLRHRNKVKTIRVMCDVCGDVMEESLMSQHMKKHSGELPESISCEQCTKKFASYKSLQLHNKTKHYVTPKFYCDICGRSFILENNLKNHLKLNHVPKLFKKPKKIQPQPHEKANLKCLYCSKKFLTAVSLVEHCKTHRKPEIQNTKHICHFCNALFKRTDHLKIHINSLHLKSQEFKCTICNKIFYASYILNRHMKNKHSVRGPKARVTCNYCNKSLASNEYLQRHISEFHTDEKKIQCPLCDAKFHRRVELRAHSKIHEIIQNENHKKQLIDDYCGELITSNISQREYASFKKKTTYHNDADDPAKIVNTQDDYEVVDVVDEEIDINIKNSTNQLDFNNDIDKNVEIIMNLVDIEDELQSKN